MMTGTSQQLESEYTEVVTNQGRRFIKKSDLKDYLEQSKIINSGINVRIEAPSISDKFERARFLLRNTKPEKVKDVLKIIEESYGKQFTRDFMQQEGLI